MPVLQRDDVLTLSWEHVPNLDRLSYYEVRVGSSWLTGRVLGKTCENVFEVRGFPIGEDRYFVRPRGVDGLWGGSVTARTVTTAVPAGWGATSSVAIWNGSTWRTGTLTGVEQVGDAIQIVAGDAGGTYAPDVIDLGSIARRWVGIRSDWRFVTNRAVDTWHGSATRWEDNTGTARGDFRSWRDTSKRWKGDYGRTYSWRGPLGDPPVTVTLETAYSDTPTSDPNWQPHVPGMVSCRYVYVRWVFARDDTDDYQAQLVDADLTAFAAPASGGSSGYSVAGRIFDIRDYGAVEINEPGGTTFDNTTAIAAAVAAAQSDPRAGGVVFIPSGIWNVNTQPKVPTWIRVVGTGANTSIIRANSSSFPTSTAVVRIGEGTGIVFGATLENLAIECQDITGSIGIYSNEMQERSGLINVQVIDPDSYGAHFETTGASEFTIRGFHLDASNSDPTAGLYLDGCAGHVSVYDLSFGGKASGWTGKGVLVENCSASFDDLHFERFVTGIHIGTGASCIVKNVYGHANLTNLVEISTGAVAFENLIAAGATNTLVDNVRSVTFDAATYGSIQHYTFESVYFGPIKVRVATQTGGQLANATIPDLAGVSRNFVFEGLGAIDDTQLPSILTGHRLGASLVRGSGTTASQEPTFQAAAQSDAGNAVEIPDFSTGGGAQIAAFILSHLGGGAARQEIRQVRLVTPEIKHSSQVSPFARFTSDDQSGAAGDREVRIPDFGAPGTLDMLLDGLAMADQVGYDNATSGLTATDGQAALDELAAILAGLANGMVFQGDYDLGALGAANFPSGADAGAYYVVTNAATAGTVLGSSNQITVHTGDKLIARVDSASTTDGADWTKVDTTDAVTSVAGKVGSVTLSVGDLNNIDEARFVARASGAGVGPPSSVTAAQARTILNVENGATADQEAGEILALLLGVDGIGSGLDADLLDGNQADAFAKLSANNNLAGRTTLSGGLVHGGSTYSATNAISDSDTVVFVSGSSVTLTLPSCRQRQVHEIHNTGGDSVTIDTDGADTINGSGSISLASGETVRIVGRTSSDWRAVVTGSV